MSDFTGSVSFRQHVIYLFQVAVAAPTNEFRLELDFTVFGEVYWRMRPEYPGFVRGVNRCHASV